MSKKVILTKEHRPDPYHDTYSRTVFGFWLFILTDFVLFGVIFASFCVLRNGMYGVPDAKIMFNLPYAFVQSLLLLGCSFTMGIASVGAHRENKNVFFSFMVITFLLGLLFTIFSIYDCNRLIGLGYGWEKSGFLSAFFTLIGTHLIHIFFGLLWIIVLVVPLIKNKIETMDKCRVTCLKMFWQFLNIVWVFVFALVYFSGRG
jgi:cytochrome o ubiquinol oxidase subunit 3